MPLFRYLGVPSGNYGYVESSDRDSAETTIGAGNYNASYDFVLIGSKATNGVADYNDSSSSFVTTPDVWTDLPNNGTGAYTNLGLLPKGVTKLIDTTNGYLDLSELDLGDNVIARLDFDVTPSLSDTEVSTRYVLGGGASEYSLEKLLPTARDAGKNYRYSNTTDMIYMGDDNTKNNLGKIQIKTSKPATVNNNGIALSVIKREVT